MRIDNVARLIIQIVNRPSSLLLRSKISIEIAKLFPHGSRNLIGSLF